MYETEFKHLDVRRCGPHCLAKQVGNSHYVIVQHCANCHEEFDFMMTDRPAHEHFRLLETKNGGYTTSSKT